MRRALVLCGLVLLGAAPASAAPLVAEWFITDPGIGLNFRFTMTVEQLGPNYEVEFSALNEGTHSGYYRGFGVKHLFDDSVTGVGSNWFSAAEYSGGAPILLTQFSGGLNLKTSQSDYCKDGANGHDGMVCSELTVPDAVFLTSNESIVFRFLVTGADPWTDYWHLQTKIFKGSTGNAGLGSISFDGVPQVQITSIPEPGTLTLLGTGAAAVARHRARRRRSAPRRA